MASFTPLAEQVYTPLDNPSKKSFGVVDTCEIGSVKLKDKYTFTPANGTDTPCLGAVTQFEYVDKNKPITIGAQLVAGDAFADLKGLVRDSAALANVVI